MVIFLSDLDCRRAEKNGSDVPGIFATIHPWLLRQERKNSMNVSHFLVFVDPRGYHSQRQANILHISDEYIFFSKWRGNQREIFAGRILNFRN